MEIVQSLPGDIPTILSLYDAATALQAEKAMSQWPKIDRQLVEEEIAEKRQWKMVEGNQIAVSYTHLTLPTILLV